MINNLIEEIEKLKSKRRRLLSKIYEAENNVIAEQLENKLAKVDDKLAELEYKELYISDSLFGDENGEQEKEYLQSWSNVL